MMMESTLILIGTSWRLKTNESKLMYRKYTTRKCKFFTILFFYSCLFFHSKLYTKSLSSTLDIALLRLFTIQFLELLSHLYLPYE